MIDRRISGGPLHTARHGLGLGAVVAGALIGASCAPESDLVADNTMPVRECGERSRIDEQVKQQAMSDFASAGKQCQPYDLHLSTTNPQETLWRVCCSGVMFNYIYFPQKCVVRKAAGPLTCNE